MMRRPRTHSSMPRLLNPSPLRALTLSALAFAAAAALPGWSQEDRDSSQPPAREPQLPTPAANARPGLEITDFRAGPGPYVWLQPERIASTFITNSANGLEVAVGGH